PDVIEQKPDCPIRRLHHHDDRWAEPNFSEPSVLFVADGRRNTGPAPQITRPGADGDRNAVATMSPKPLTRALSAPVCDAIGMSTRRMMCMPLLAAIGTTGWMLSSVPVVSRSPRPKSQFTCSGKLIRLDTGFCVCLASSSASWANVVDGIITIDTPNSARNNVIGTAHRMP